MQVRKQQLELDREQQTGSKLGKEYVKAVYCHPALLISISIFPGGLVAGILGFLYHDPGSFTGQEADCQAIWHSQKSKKNFF